MKPERARLLVAIVFIGLAAVLLFARLGHYPLWTDEAGTALVAKGVLRTGDTTALPDDHNVYALYYGRLLKDLKIRYWAPLQAYLTAPSLALFGERSAFAARLPFALCGLAGYALLLYWLWREKAPPLFALLVAFALVVNVSFLLYARQCRYYSPATFASIAIGCVYYSWNGRRSLAVLSTLLVILLSASYLNYAALVVCLLLDYFLWRRKTHPLGGRDWLILLGPQLIIGGLMVWHWNPYSVQPLPSDTVGWGEARMKLFWWNWRDLNICEFGILALLVAVPFAYFRSRNAWLLRGSLALFVYVLAVAILSPQRVGTTANADVRYIAPIIPLCVVLEVMALCVFTRNEWRIALPLAGLIFGTNLLNGGPLLEVGFRSTLRSYVNELAHPIDDPYTDTIKWINENMKPGQSVWVQPDFHCQSLMFHAPQVVYAWQLDEPVGQFAALPPIHFFGRVPPDYIIAFGPHLTEVAKTLKEINRPGFTYRGAGAVDRYWFDLYRPELYMHTFQSKLNYNPTTEAIYMFQRVSQPPP